MTELPPFPEKEPFFDAKGNMSRRWLDYLRALDQAERSTSETLAEALAGFTTPSGSSGHVSFPSGLILQWGAANGGASVTFPIAFHTAVLDIQVTAAQNAARYGTSTSVSVSGFTLKGWASGGGADTGAYHWLALGY